MFLTITDGKKYLYETKTLITKKVHRGGQIMELTQHLFSH